MHEIIILIMVDCLCGLVVRVPDHRSRDPRFDFGPYQISWKVVGLERGPLSLVSITEELLEWKSSGSGSRKQRLTALAIRCADHATSSIADMRQTLGRYSSLADFLNVSNHSNRTMALESSHPLTKISARNLPGVKKLPARRADNLTAICESNVWKCVSLNLSQI
jgi:hypothetical protein